MKFGSFVFVAFFLAGSAFAFESEVSEQNTSDELALAIDHGEFLACVSSRHECEHEAQYHGYHHSVAVRDPYTCHHDHHAQFACYGE